MFFLRINIVKLQQLVHIPRSIDYSSNWANLMTSRPKPPSNTTYLHVDVPSGHPLNKKLVSCHRPSGLKRSDWNFFFVKKKKFGGGNSQFSQYILVYEHEKQKEKKSRPPDWPLYCPPGGQETIYHLRLALLPFFCVVGSFG